MTFEEILALPGNQVVYDSLIPTISAGRAIAFVGAGASAGMYPLWTKFIELLADHTVAEGRAEPKDADRWKADTASTPQQRVSVIVRRLGEDRYRRFLKHTFGPRRAHDGRRYTATHAALMRLPFLGYVTTNYDPALDFARMELRPNCLTTGTPSWQDDDEIHRWYTGETFADADACPILWLHGHWQRPAAIVLNSAEYLTAYKPGLYRRLFDALWGQRQMVFIGFGFNDPQFTVMVGEYLRDLQNSDAIPRHVAILGLPEDDQGQRPDLATIIEWRENFEADYHLRALFYPVVANDHSALNVLLDGLVAACGYPGAEYSPPEITALPLIPEEARQTVPARWVHETTNDGRFTGREDEIARLNRWVQDDAIRTLGISGVGGTGKTALIGYWLRHTLGWQSRAFDGLFAWSFYQDRDTRSFLRELFRWAQASFGTVEPAEDSELVRASIALIEAHPLLIVLDGLEVLQEGTEESHHGTFLDRDLRELLVAFCQRTHNSLAVLTSRFVFADLDRFLGTTFHQLELHGLSPSHGGKLLEELGVGGSPAEREAVSESMDGHPLGLRVFAEALPVKEQNQPLGFLEYAFRLGEIPEGAPLSDKLRRLLIFYEKKLPAVQMRLLGVIALFRSPVSDETLLRLTRGLFGHNDAEILPGDATLLREMKKLHSRGILTREPTETGFGSACHPILRDHFRAVLLGAGTDTAHRAADLLTNQPATEKPRKITDIEAVLLAIELLLEAANFDAADELYHERLDDGRVFLWLPAPTEGITCALGFVRNENWQQSRDPALARRQVAYYLNEAGLFAMAAGRYDIAQANYARAASIYRIEEYGVGIASGLINQAELLVNLGRFPEARRAASEALTVATQGRDEELVRDSRVAYGWLSLQSGDLRASVREFAVANEIEKLNHVGGSELYSMRGALWAELLLRGGQLAEARRRTLTNLQVCLHNRWNDDIARCRFILGWCALRDRKLGAARAYLTQAENTFYQGQTILELIRVHLAMGELAVAERDGATASARAEEALDLAAPRRMRLLHADALVLRGCAKLLEASSDSIARAADDADEALRISRDCGYPWAERDALVVSAEAQETLAAIAEAKGERSLAERKRELSRSARGDADSLNAKLVLTDDDLVMAHSEAKIWIADWTARRQRF